MTLVLLLQSQTLVTFWLWVVGWPWGISRLSGQLFRQHCCFWVVAHKNGYCILNPTYFLTWHCVKHLTCSLILWQPLKYSCYATFLWVDWGSFAVTCSKSYAWFYRQSQSQDLDHEVCLTHWLCSSPLSYVIMLNFKVGALHVRETGSRLHYRDPGSNMYYL